MEQSRVLYDFSILLKLSSNNLWPLSKTDQVTDSHGNTIPLSDGMHIFFYDYNFDIFDRRDYLIADGIVVRNPDKGSDIKCCCQISELGVRYESSNPNLKLPELPLSEKRSATYRKLDKQISLTGTQPNCLVNILSNFI